MNKNARAVIGWMGLAVLAISPVWSAAASTANKIAPDLRTSLSIAREQRVIVTYLSLIHI